MSIMGYVVNVPGVNFIYCDHDLGKAINIVGQIKETFKSLLPEIDIFIQFRLSDGRCGYYNENSGHESVGVSWAK